MIARVPMRAGTTEPHAKVAPATPKAGELAPLDPRDLFRLITQLPRDQIADIVSIGIELLDVADGDSDLEEDDWPEQDDPAGVVDEDGVNTGTERDCAGLPIATGAGCPIFDDDDDGRDMPHAVPAIPVYALEPDPVSGERAFLGLSNLQTTYRTNGREVRSADSGRGPPIATLCTAFRCAGLSAE